MSGKRVAFSAARPSEQRIAAGADDWVTSRNGSDPEVAVPDPDTQAPQAQEPLKRLTLDIPESLHRAIKAQCAADGTKMVVEIRHLLEQKYRKS